MDEISLTANAATVLKRLCKQYKKRLKDGASKSEAADFDSSKVIHAEFFPKWDFEDVDAACSELLRGGMLCGFRADGYVYCAVLSDAAIAFSENRASKNASRFVGSVLDLIQAIRSLLPW